MSKNKARSKEEYNQPGERGMFYLQRKCRACGKLIWGASPRSRKLASRDSYFKMRVHKKDCQASQLNLSLSQGEDQGEEKEKDTV